MRAHGAEAGRRNEGNAAALGGGGHEERGGAHGPAVGVRGTGRPRARGPITGLRAGGGRFGAAPPPDAARSRPRTPAAPGPTSAPPSLPVRSRSAPPAPLRSAPLHPAPPRGARGHGTERSTVFIGLGTSGSHLLPSSSPPPPAPGQHGSIVPGARHRGLPRQNVLPKLRLVTGGRWAQNSPPTPPRQRAQPQSCWSSGSVWSSL